MNTENLIQFILKQAQSLIAYHGSPFDFNSFSFKKHGLNDKGDFGKGFYFDTDIRQAIAYARNSGFLYTCEIKLNKPYKIDRTKHYDKKEINLELNKYIEDLKLGGLKVDDKYIHINGQWNNTTFLTLSRAYGSDKITQALLRAGYDGVIVNWGSSNEVVVFNTNNVKIISKEENKQAQSQNSWTLVPSKPIEKPTYKQIDNVDKNFKIPHNDQIEMFLDKSNEDEDDEWFFDYNPNMPDPTPRTLNKDFGKFQNL